MPPLSVFRMYGLPDPNEARPAAPRREPYPVEPLSPQEEESYLSQLGGNALTGLSWLGTVLDTPGSVVRGLVHGTPERALGGIFDPSQRVHGRELLHQSPDTPFFSGEGMGAFGAEIALDPLTYLTFGGSALSRAGQAARKVGQLAKGGRAQIAAGQRGLVGFGLPFMDPVAVAGTGQAGLNTLDALGAVARPVARYTGLEMAGRALAPLGRQVRALFDAPVQGMVTREGQAAGRAGYEMLQQGLPRARAEQLRFLKDIQARGVDPDEAVRYLTGQVEPLAPAEALRQAQARGLTGTGLQDEVDRLINARPDARLAPVVDDLRQRMGAMYATEEALGSTVGHRPNYFPQFMTPLEQQTPGFFSSRSGLGTFHPSMLAREEILDIPGGREAVNRLAKDAEIRRLVGEGSEMQQRSALTQMGAPLPANLQNLPPTRLKAAVQIRENYLGYTDAAETTRRSLMRAHHRRTLTPSEEVLLRHLNHRMGATTKQARHLADWVQKNVDPKYAKEGLDFFGNHPAQDYLQRLVSHETVTANMRALHDLLASSAVPATAATPDMVNLNTALAQLGMGRGGVPTASGKQTLTGRLADLGKQGPSQHYFIDPKIVADAQRFGQATAAPKALEGFLRGWDSLSNFTKTTLTSLWPAFHSRNAVTGGFMNWVGGAFSPGATMAAATLRKGGIVEWANQLPGLQHLSPEQATRQVAEWGHVYGLTGTREGFFADLTGLGAHQAQRATPALPGPGNVQQGPLEAYLGGFRELAQGKNWNPLQTAGVGGQRVDKFALAKGGREAGQSVDEINRMGGFIELLRQGWNPEQAAARMKELHYDYSKLAGFEKSVMRRVAPFYNWMRHNVPFVLNELVERPGGRMALGVRAGAEARGEEPGFLPKWLGQGLALPLGESAPGTTRFLTSLGLPFEDVAQMASPAGALSALSPYIKMPVELATGTQLYTGRQLADLHGLTGNTVVDQLLYNSPVSRAVTTGRTLLDERKGLGAKALNLLTGARLTDVDLEQQRGIRTRDLIQEQLRGRPGVRTFQRQFVSPEDLELLSPYDLALLRLARTQELRARQQNTP